MMRMEMTYLDWMMLITSVSLLKESSTCKIKSSNTK